MLSVSIPDFQHGAAGALIKRRRALSPYGSQFVRYSLRETHCGRFVNVAVVARWLRYDEPDFIRDRVRELERSAQRAKRRVKERVMTLGADRMLTATYRANEEDYEKAVADVRKFIARMRLLHKNWKYVCVAEQQERGAWHFHIAVKGYQHWNTLRREWLRVVGDGAVNDNHDRFRNKHLNAAKIADYLSKYMGKGFNDEDKPHYRHLYLTSRGISPEVMRYAVIGFYPEELQELMSSLLAARGKRSVTRYWKDDGYEGGGARSW